MCPKQTVTHVSGTELGVAVSLDTHRPASFVIARPKAEAIQGRLRKWLWIASSLRSLQRRQGGGGSGIRTHDTVSRIHAFQACAFSHSAIPPVVRRRRLWRTCSLARRSAAKAGRGEEGQYSIGSALTTGGRRRDCREGLARAAALDDHSGERSSNQETCHASPL